MTNDPAFAAMLMLAGITGAVLIAAVLSNIIDRVINKTLPPFEQTRADSMRNHIRRMKR